MSSPRSLADDLRRRDDDALACLLVLRPDLVHPVPPDFTALTSRATAGPSVARCLDTLHAVHLHVLRVVALCTAQQPRSADEIVALASEQLPQRADDVCRAALDDLIMRALVWGDREALRAIAPAADLVASAPVPAWPQPDGSGATVHPVQQVDRQAGLRARESLALTRDLLDHWSTDPPSVLRSGGLPLRDFAAARALVHEDWPRTALTIEVAAAAHLVADDEEEAPAWVPTDRFDSWLESPPAHAWADLVEAWLSLPRLPSLAGEKARLLTSDSDRRPILAVRRSVIDVLMEQEPGAALDAEQLTAILDHRRPRQAGTLRDQVVAATLREGEDLGVLGFGALSTAARVLLEDAAGGVRGRTDRLIRLTSALTDAMPEDVDHVLIQGDLTITAPGPLAASISRRLGLLADIESRGHATVYRVTESSVRRALDAGMDAEGIHAFLREISRTPIPQPLTYLVDDVARRHGAVRVGTALSYLRSDAADTLAALLEDRRLASLGLHRIAETVLICTAPSSEVISTLRAAGYAPAAEGPDGGIVIRRPDDHRIRTPRFPATTAPRRTEAALITAAVRTLRAGDRASAPRQATVVGPAAASGGVPRLQANAIVAALRSAISENRSMWIGYADTDGTVGEQVIDPIRLSAGVLTAFDHRTDGVRTFSVSRVTGVAETR
jgi:hypothetical protein